MSREAYVPPELAASARELIMAFGHWCDDNEDLVQQDDWTYAQLVDMFLMECGANGAFTEDGPDIAGDASSRAVGTAASVGSDGILGKSGPDLIAATRGVLLLRDRLGREWTAGVLIAPAEAAGAAALPLASEGARRLDLRLITLKVVEE